MNSHERAYLQAALADPTRRAELRLDAAGRHARIVWDRARAGKYDDLSYREKLLVLKEHSDTIDEFYDNGGWKRGA